MLYELLFIINVEIPDMEADSLGGKKTLIVVYGQGIRICYRSNSCLNGYSILLFNDPD